MALKVETITLAATDIKTAETAFGTHTATANEMVSFNFWFTGMASGASNMTVRAYYTPSGGSEFAIHGSGGQAYAKTDTTYTQMMFTYPGAYTSTNAQKLYMNSGDALRFTIQSSNASDTNVAGRCEVVSHNQQDIYAWRGTNVATPATAGVPSVDTIAISGDTSAADEAELAFNDGMTELTSIPGATPKLREALMLHYQALRNALSITNTSVTIGKDNGVAIGSAALTDDGSTFIKDEFA